MKYRAKKYMIRRRGMVKPGDVFEANYGHEQEAKLLEAGTIERMGVQEEMISAGAADDVSTDMAGDMPDVAGEYADDGVEAVEEAPEIDPTEGIVEAKPAKKGGKKQ